MSRKSTLRSSRSILWEVAAPVVRWPMRSPVRLGGTLAALLVVLWIFSHVGGGQGSASAASTSVSLSTSMASATSPVAASSTSVSPSGSASTPAPGPTAATGGPVSVSLAQTRMTAFMEAWVATKGKTAAQWRKGMERYEDEALRAGMRYASPSRVPAHKLTGQVKTSIVQGGQGATGLVPTDAGTMFVSAVSDGSTWWVVDVEPLPVKATNKPSTTHKARVTNKPSSTATKR